MNLLSLAIGCLILIDLLLRLLILLDVRILHLSAGIALRRKELWRGPFLGLEWYANRGDSLGRSISFLIRGEKEEGLLKELLMEWELGLWAPWISV